MYLPQNTMARVIAPEAARLGTNLNEALQARKKSSPVPTPSPELSKWRIAFAEKKVTLHLLLYSTTFGFGFCLCGDTDFPATMSKSGIPDDLPVGSDSFPRHAPIQQ